jgi:hypothetical protein
VLQEGDHRLEHLHRGLGRDGVVVAEVQPTLRVTKPVIGGATAPQGATADRRVRAGRPQPLRSKSSRGEVEGPVAEPADGVGDVGRNVARSSRSTGCPSAAMSLAASVMSRAVEYMTQCPGDLQTLLSAGERECGRSGSGSRSQRSGRQFAHVRTAARWLTPSIVASQRALFSQPMAKALDWQTCRYRSSCSVTLWWVGR